jgi:hypothetical protein
MNQTATADPHTHRQHTHTHAGSTREHMYICSKS